MTNDNLWAEAAKANNELHRKSLVQQKCTLSPHKNEGVRPPKGVKPDPDMNIILVKSLDWPDTSKTLTELSARQKKTATG